VPAPTAEPTLTADPAPMDPGVPPIPDGAAASVPPETRSWLDRIARRAR
jgi:hypothetical protein